MFSRSGYLGIIAILGLMGLTLFMAFAFPYSLFQVKQSETSELKAVIIVGRSGEHSPTINSYFTGENPPDELEQQLGYEQLTNTGKERMYLMGKFLKLRYESLLLSGNPREVYARSVDTDRALESLQALLAGLNPPKDEWIWSKDGDLLNWQPKAIHTSPASSDDLLSPGNGCLRLEHEKKIWKNSTRYHQLLKEFRHDFQSLRSNTGFHFESDLELIANIQEFLEVRKAYKNSAPEWYTSSLANRLYHIVDTIIESHYSNQDIQRLSIGRLLYEIDLHLKSKIQNHENSKGASKDSSSKSTQQAAQVRAANKFTGPNVFVYMTDKDQLSALMSSLQIYSNQPTFGTLLLVELHYSPIDHVHFQRIFKVSSNIANVFPELVRVNTPACADTIECDPQQFQQSLRHLMMDRRSWIDACVMIPNEDQTTSMTTLPELITTPGTTLNESSEKSLQEFDLTSTIQLPSTTISSSDLVTNSTDLDKLDDNLIVGPTHLIPTQQHESTTEPANLEVTTISSDRPIDTTTETIRITTDDSSRLQENSVISQQSTGDQGSISTTYGSVYTQQPNISEISEPTSTFQTDLNDSLATIKEVHPSFPESAIFQPFTQT